jgi:hypothetical protein
MPMPVKKLLRPAADPGAQEFFLQALLRLNWKETVNHLCCAINLEPLQTETIRNGASCFAHLSVY